MRMSQTVSAFQMSVHRLVTVVMELAGGVIMKLKAIILILLILSGNILLCASGEENNSTEEEKSAVCSNGILENGEECDPPDGITCNDDCTYFHGESPCDLHDPYNCMVVETICGNSVVEDSESCDDGNSDDTDDCLFGCTLSSCGDGIVQLSGSNIEECDDGNTDPGDGCNENCQIE